MGRQRKEHRVLRLYVRVFKRNGRDSKVVNKTYSIRDYVGYVSMMSELRSTLWSVYWKEFIWKERGAVASSAKVMRSRPATTSGRRRPGI